MGEESGALRRTGAIMAIIGVGLGAFGAHGLDGRLTAQALGWWDTATFYLLVHAVAVTGLGLVAAGRRARRGGWVMAVGALVFAGTLYAMALGAPTALGMVTPLGGVLMIGGWVGVALSRG